MRNERMNVYYNEKFGYIFTAKTRVKDTLMQTNVMPIETTEKDISEEYIGEKIFEYLEKSKVAKAIERTEAEKNNFWHVTGIKGYKTFIKKFNCVDIEKIGDNLQITSYSIKGSPKILKPISISYVELGATILEFIGLKSTIEEVKENEFKTINGSIIKYVPPNEEYLDIEDGGTDAYKVFIRDVQGDNNIAFLIDSGYSQMNEESIRNKWNEMYGVFKEFKFKECNKKEYILNLVAKTNKVYVCAYIFNDGEDFLEIRYEIDQINTSVEQQKLIINDFENIVKSIKIINYN